MAIPGNFNPSKLMEWKVSPDLKCLSSALSSPDATFSCCGGFYSDVDYMIQIQSLTLSMDLSGIFSLLHNYLIHLSLVCWWWTLSSKFATFQLHRPLQAVANNCAEFTIRTVQSPSDRLCQPQTRGQKNQCL